MTTFTLSDRIVGILKELAKEPSKASLHMGDEGWIASHEDECAICGGEAIVAKSSRSMHFKHRPPCPVFEAKQILRDHGLL